MIKQALLTGVAVLSLGTVAINTQPQPVQAQKLHQAIPEKYWGNWKYKQTKVMIHPHEVKGPGFHYKGKSLGVRKNSKKSISIFQTYKGKQASPSFVLKRTKHHHKLALRANFDGTVEYYMRKGIF